MATVQREVRKRGLFGKLMLILFWIWQVLMVIWLVSAIAGMGAVEQPTTEAGQAGAAIGSVIGLGIIFSFWGFGTLIFGALALMTRGARLLITEEV